MSDINLVNATMNDVSDVCELLNLSYRGEQGWTTEYGLVSGDRASIEYVSSMIMNNDSHVLLYKEEEKLIASICLEKRSEGDVYIGSFSVRPEYQGLGLGKRVLAAAEQYGAFQLTAKRYVMIVLSGRPELIAFYERRGYSRDGIALDYPTDLNVGIPIVDNLTLEQLSKPVRY